MNIIIVQDEKQFNTLKRAWEAYKQDLECGRAKLGSRNTIYYYRHKGEDGEFVWEIYNYHTMDHEVCEGDLAGLCNSRNGNFPFFN